MTTLDELLDRTLPLNRKERYYTGTVLPALLCANSMSALARLGGPDLLGIGKLDVRADPDNCTVLFFSEYSLIESAIDTAATRFPGMSQLPKDTPDIVILITKPKPVLIALEAKMYDRPSRPALKKQLAAQKSQLDQMCAHLADHLNVDQIQLAHWALLPDTLAQSMPDLGTPILTWEQILTAYSDVDQPYFHAILATALQRYDALVSKWAGYQQGELAGAFLVTRHLAGDTTWPYMGVSGGLHGTVMQDLLTGSWATRVFQVRHDPLPGNNNWFSVSDFIDALQANGQDVNALGPANS